MDRLKSIFEKVYMRTPYIGSLLFIDLETTGLERDARIIEIGAIRTSFDGFDVNFDTFESLINPDMRIEPKITEVTGITNEELEVAPKEEIIYPKFVSWYVEREPERIIAHNAKFDESKLRTNLFRMGYSDILYRLPRFECTMNMSKQLIKTASDDKLKTLSEHYGFVNTNAHRALADAEVCSYVWCKMKLGEYEQ